MLGESTRSGNRSGDVLIQSLDSTVVPSITDINLGVIQDERETAMEFNKGNKIIIPLKGDAVSATIQPDLNESIHMTRHSRVIKKPNKYFDTLPSSTTTTNHSNSNSNSNLSTPLTSPTKHSRRSSVNNITPPTIINPTPAAITLNFTSLSSSSNVISSPLQFQQPSTTSAAESITSTTTSIPSISAADKKRHPRDLVPLDIGFPTLSTKGKVQPVDQEDRILMAICRILMDHENRALCPKEIADTMEEKGWLMNAGTTPFAHVSTCIRSHLKRASTSIPPYQPLLISFELAGSISPLELEAIGLLAHEQPAVKRGTLWYLDERAFGPNLGAEDPFNRVRRENGLEPTGKDGLYVRGVNVVPVAVPPAIVMAVEEEDDHDGMGRGKRKRRASTAATGGTLELLAPSILSTSTPSSTAAVTSTSTISIPIPIPIPTKYKHIVGQAHHWSTTRKNAAAASAASAAAAASASASETNNTLITSTSTVISTSAPSKLGIPRLRLKLSALEEVDSSHDDSDGQTSDAAARRRNRKKPRRAASEGGRWVTSRGGGPVRVGRGRPRIRISAGGSSNGTDTRSERSEKMEEDSSRSSSEDEQEVEVESEKIMLSRSTPAAFSSVSSSALLAKSLLAASTSNSTTAFINVLTTSQTVISPNSLHYSSFDSRISTNPRHLLSMSAPSPYSATTFTSLQSRDTMDVETVISIIKEEDDEEDEADQDDFNEAMLRGEDFDFEWGTESYSAPNSPLLLPLSTPSYPVVNLETTSSVSTTVPPQSPTPSTLSIITISPSKEKGKEREISIGPLDEPFDLDLELDLTEGMDDASTPATTPRSPPAKDEEFIETPTTGTFRGGLEVTLCGVFAQEGEEDSKPDTGISLLDRTASTDSLTSLVEDDQEEPESSVTVTQLAVDATTLSLPLPSPLALGLPPMLSLTNNAFSTDYNFVGHEEDDRSAYRNYQYDGEDRDGAESADDEDEDDEIVTIKLEDDSPTGSATNSARSSRQSSACAYPLESFSRRLMVSNLSNSSSSTDSDSEDHFDSHMIVSNSLLATGMAVPLVAPSPPELTEWGIELDDLEVELGSDTELVGPETVGLDELDAAWGASSQLSQPSESMDLEEDIRIKRHEEDLASTSSFLTRSPINTHSPIMSPVRSIESSLSSLPLPSPATDSSFTTARSINTQATHPDTSSIIVYPTIPLSPVIIAKIVQKGVAVYSTEIIDVDTQVTYSLLRRIDTDFVNCTNLLRLTHTSLVEREKIISELDETLKVVSGGPDIEGQWLPLASAFRIKEMFQTHLSSLDVFLKGDLGTFFPAPIPSLTNWAAQQDPISSSVTLSTAPKAKTRRGSNTRVARRRSLVTEESERESSPEVLPTRIPGARGSRRN